MECLHTTEHAQCGVLHMHYAKDLNVCLVIWYTYTKKQKVHLVHLPVEEVRSWASNVLILAASTLTDCCLSVVEWWRLLSDMLIYFDSYDYVQISSADSCRMIRKKLYWSCIAQPFVEWYLCQVRRPLSLKAQLPKWAACTSHLQLLLNQIHCYYQSLEVPVGLSLLELATYKDLSL